MSEDYTVPLKKGTRWEKFGGDELKMIAYGLSQIYDHTPKDLVNKLLKELNPICFPSFTKPISHYSSCLERTNSKGCNKEKCIG